MENKNVIKIINEVISEFDFLGNDEHTKEQETIDLLKNEDLQKQFICDALLNKNIKIVGVSDARLGGNWDAQDFDDASKLTIEYFLKIQYTYDPNKEPIIFDLDFDSDEVSIGVTGWQDRGRFGGTPDTDIEPSGEAWFDQLNWNDIDVTLFTTDGDEIPFIAFQKAPPRIQTLFIRNFTENFIGKQTGMDIRTKEMKDKIQNVPYC
jgi:hypothetical protein